MTTLVTGRRGLWEATLRANLQEPDIRFGFWSGRTAICVLEGLRAERVEGDLRDRFPRTRHARRATGVSRGCGLSSVGAPSEEIYDSNVRERRTCSRPRGARACSGSCTRVRWPPLRFRGNGVAGRNESGLR